MPQLLLLPTITEPQLMFPHFCSFTGGTDLMEASDERAFHRPRADARVLAWLWNEPLHIHHRFHGETSEST